MALEIERKFLVANDSYLSMATGSRHIWQGYMSDAGAATVRLRIADDHAFLTIKSRNRGLTRNEWEYEIPLSDAHAMTQVCNRSLEKTRYIVPFEGYVWEVDIFHGRHSWLALAEIELPAEDAEFVLPPFVGDEVTGNPRYYNSNLCKA